MHAEGFAVVDWKRVFEALLAASILGTGFGLAIIGVEIWFVRYPQDMNVALPDALLFYPGMGYLVEVGFHLLPLALLCVLTRPLKKLLNPEFRLWFCIAAVAVIEPKFQSEIEAQPRAYTWFHVFAFNLAQLVLFRKFGFVAMFGMRLVYYLYWHLLWGAHDSLSSSNPALSTDPDPTSPLGHERRFPGVLDESANPLMTRHS